ncbi:VOC family protein [Xanthobacter autotrophicus DSM 431]|uniref:VOC family protein n=1 Tax=Xanthobacter nonsaccharivorans TaxID=3119912 RepID=UPI003727014D
MTTATSLSPSIAPHDLTLGAVTLVSADPERLVPFYRDAVGLEPMSSGETIVLGAGGRALVEIRRDADAPRPPRRAPGLFHMAIRVPDRPSLAARLLALHRLGQKDARIRLGASDHLVSEALYVDDPDGNGIEIYRDRPAAEWPRTPDGAIAMATLPLDLAALAREAPANPQLAPAGTDMGHVHLKVSDLEAARRFWVETMGFAIMARYPGALFVSADGYHHHIGLNVWQSEGAAAPRAGSQGLGSFTILLPQDAIDALKGRLAAAGVAFETPEGGGLKVADPSGNVAIIRAG